MDARQRTVETPKSKGLSGDLESEEPTHSKRVKWQEGEPFTRTALRRNTTCASPRTVSNGVYQGSVSAFDIAEDCDP